MSMKSGSIRLFAFALLTLAVPISFGASDKNAKEADAQLLDHGEYACSNCFFGPSTYYFCFRADNRILIARDTIPTFNWRDPQQNYFCQVLEVVEDVAGAFRRAENQVRRQASLGAARGWKRRQDDARLHSRHLHQQRRMPRSRQEAGATVAGSEVSRNAAPALSISNGALPASISHASPA